MDNKPPLEDFLETWSCVGIPTRRPQELYGTALGSLYYVPLDPSDPTSKSKNPQIMEWQVAQDAMACHYTANFKAKHPDLSCVFSERDYLYVRTQSGAVNGLLERMTTGFKNWRKVSSRGGALRPDMLGLYVNPLKIRTASHIQVGVELLEVTTERQWKDTLKNDVKYKIESLNAMAANLEGDIRQSFNADSVAFTVRPGTWQPGRIDQRYVWLPSRTYLDASGKMRHKLEWICFNPTFRQNDGRGIDGLLLYEVHSVEVDDFDMTLLNNVAKMFAREEVAAQKRRRQEERLLPLPWLTPESLNEFLTPQEKRALGYAAGAIGLALFAYFAVPGILALGAEGGALTAAMMRASILTRAAPTAPVAVTGAIKAVQAVSQSGASERIIRCGTAYSEGMQSAVQWSNTVRVAQASRLLPTVSGGIQGGIMRLHH